MANSSVSQSGLNILSSLISLVTQFVWSLSVSSSVYRLSTNLSVHHVVHPKPLLTVYVQRLWFCLLFCVIFFLLSFPFTFLCLLSISHTGLGITSPLFYLSSSVHPPMVHLQKIVLVFPSGMCCCFFLLLYSPCMSLELHSVPRLLVTLHLLKSVCILGTVSSCQYLRDILS